METTVEHKYTQKPPTALARHRKTPEHTGNT